MIFVRKTKRNFEKILNKDFYNINKKIKIVQTEIEEEINSDKLKSKLDKLVLSKRVKGTNENIL